MSSEPVDRRAYSMERLATLGEQLRPLEPLLAGRPLCIYATGSQEARWGRNARTPDDLESAWRREIRLVGVVGVVVGLRL